jgi:hypothetical protein
MAPFDKVDFFVGVDPGAIGFPLPRLGLDMHLEGNLRKDGSQYLNDLYGKSKVTVRLDIRGGVGSIRLIG